MGTPIWPFVASFNMYDPLTLLAAHPSTLQKFFEPTVKVVNGVSHLVVGVDAEVTGVKDKQSLRAFMMNALRYALSQSVKHALGSTEREKAHDLKIKRREAAGKSTPARERREVAGPIASKETMQWGMDGLDAKGEASYIGLDATHVAVELKELNDHFQFTRTHYQNTSYQMTRTGAHDLVRIMYDDEEKVKCFKYK